MSNLGISNIGIGNIYEPKQPKPDRKAEQEENDIVNKGKRDGQFKNHVHLAKLSFIWVCFACVVALVLGKSILLILPTKERWLTPDQISNLNEFFTDGSIGGLVVSFFKSIMENKE